MGSSEASLRWRLLRHHLLSQQPGSVTNQELIKVSRRPHGRFGLLKVEKLILAEVSCEEAEQLGGTLIKYILPTSPVIELILLLHLPFHVEDGCTLPFPCHCQRKEDEACLADHAYATKHHIDMTGLVGLWPAEEVLTYYCVSNPALFRNKKVLELGSGYGLAGLAIAACTEAAEVVLTDGNPQVIEYVMHNIRTNQKGFGETKVDACVLHWCNDVSPMMHEYFDIIIAADCTFFSTAHVGLACTMKGLLKRCKESRALLFNPQRNCSLDAFLQVARNRHLDVELREQYDGLVWSLHLNLLEGETPSWYNYDADHCYPLLATLTHSNGTATQNMS